MAQQGDQTKQQTYSEDFHNEPEPPVFVSQAKLTYKKLLWPRA